MFENVNFVISKSLERKILSVIFTTACIIRHGEDMHLVQHAQRGIEIADKLLEKLKSSSQEKL